MTFSNFSGYGVINIIDYQCAKPWVLNGPTPNPPETIRRLAREQRNYSGCQNPNPTRKTARNLAFLRPVNACGEWLDGRRLERAKGFEPSTPTLARLCSTPELRPRSVEARLIGGFDLDCKPVNGRFWGIVHCSTSNRPVSMDIDFLPPRLDRADAGAASGPSPTMVPPTFIIPRKPWTGRARDGMFEPNHDTACLQDKAAHLYGRTGPTRGE